jgi:hypothetical protein
MRRTKWRGAPAIVLALLLLAAFVAALGTRGAFADVLSFGGMSFVPGISTDPCITDANSAKGSSLPLDEAQAKYGFDLPTVVPRGYELIDERVTVTDMSIPGFSQGEVLIEIAWLNESREAIRLSVQRTDPTVEYDDVIAPEMARELTVNGKTVAYLTGAWDASSDGWSSEDLITLSWHQGRDIYDLSGKHLTELLPMVESMPHFR